MDFYDDKIKEVQKDFKIYKNLNFKKAIEILKSNHDLIGVLPWFGKGEGFMVNKFGWLYGNRPFGRAEAFSSEWSVFDIKNLPK